MDQKKLNRDNMPEELQIEECNRLCQEELRIFGFIRDFRLADAYDVPKHQAICFRYNDGKIVFEKLPVEVKELYFLIKQGKVDIFTQKIEGLELLFDDRKLIKLEAPKLNCSYDLNSDSGTESSDFFRGSGILYFENTISGPEHFIQVDSSGINVIILNDGYIRVDLVRFACESISFRMSDKYENTLDVFSDDEEKPGDIYVTNVRNGMIIKNPVLASALKHQATIGPLDMKKGLYYAVCTFRIVPGAKTSQLIDTMKYLDESSYVYNMNLFANG